MEDVSDPPFRALCKKHGADVMYTEFISSEGLIRDALKSKKKLDIFEDERPVGIQIFGSEIESMKRATELAAAPTGAVGVAKNLLNRAAGMDQLDVHLDAELTELARIANGPNFAEGLEAFFQKRSPEFESE